MRLDQAAIVLRPRGLLGSADLAFRFLSAVRPRLWLWLAAMFLLPAVAGVFVLRAVYEVSWPLLWVIAIAYGGIAQGVFSTAAGLLMFDQGTRLSFIVSQYFKRLPTYVAAVGLSRLLSIALFPFALLGFFLWARWAYVSEAVVLEQASLLRAGKRSADFLRGHMDDGVFLLVVLFGLNVSLAVCMEELGHGVEQLLLLPIHVESLWEEGGSIYAAVGYFVSLPLCAVIRFLSYIDGRTRRDGWDIQVRFMALAAEAEAAHAERLGDGASK